MDLERERERERESEFERWEQDPLYLKISQFVHFMVQILFLGFNSVQTATSFKI